MIVIGKSYLKYIRLSPKKAKLVADAIRGKSVYEVKNILKFIRKRAAVWFSKALSGAIASYKEKTGNSDIDESNILVYTEVKQGPTWRILKPAIKPMRFGGYSTFKRRTSHILLEVVEIKDWQDYIKKRNLPYSKRREVIR
ncbi:MAG: 50S ribosomal protein L22 [candidate division WOR-3 bacterium]|nr:50S ribosomal protein L22 [candidate division WOR-3 bacterium]MCX7947941.1 50S ribosomal protein L22 [candidate division WOR-3 bacterium]MDW8150885.1 uL22 family ribosomal protein [candidate division WOR-3 bacterium]